MLSPTTVPTVRPATQFWPTQGLSLDTVVIYAFDWAHSYHKYIMGLAGFIRLSQSYAYSVDGSSSRDALSPRLVPLPARVG